MYGWVSEWELEGSVCVCMCVCVLLTFSWGWHFWKWVCTTWVPPGWFGMCKILLQSACPLTWHFAVSPPHPHRRPYIRPLLRCHLHLLLLPAQCRQPPDCRIPLGILVVGSVSPISHRLKCLHRFDQVIFFPLLVEFPDHIFCQMSLRLPRVMNGVRKVTSPHE